MTSLVIAWAISAGFAASTSAATAPCHTVTGDHLTGRDLAKALPAFAEIAPETVIGYAPQPGAHRNLEPAELTRIAAANGLEYHGIATVCFEPELAELEPSRIEKTIRESLLALSITTADLEVIEYSKSRVPPGKLSFPIESLPAWAPANTAIWNGYVEHENHRYTVWARVRIAVPQTRVVTVGNLRAGQRIEPAEVRLEEVKAFPMRVPALESLSACVGMLARRYLTVGAPVSVADLMEPFDVDRGEMATVEVQIGGAVLKLEAEAQASGRRGEMIALRNATSGKIFRAKITGKGRALLEYGPSGIEK
jgi:flagella basal body P-ring formation protein FlgA